VSRFATGLTRGQQSAGLLEIVETFADLIV
jgi:hypothetical protein